MKNHNSEFPIVKMAQLFEVSRSGYYRYENRKISRMQTKRKKLVSKIKTIFLKSRRNYGSPRIHAVLKKQGEACSRRLIANIMKQNNIQAKSKKKWKPTLAANKDLSLVSPNLLKQNFSINKANVVWALDITYVWTREGWLYVSAILDLYSRKIVGLSMCDRMDADLVLRSLRQAILHRKPPAGLILHSDRGTQYTSHKYTEFAKKNDFIVSMSSKGNCYDNAVMESFFHTLKTEHVFFNKFETRKEATRSIFDYVEIFYNRQRLHSTLKYFSPLEFEMQELALVESRVKIAKPATEANVFVFTL